jgi:hypothetical protein
MPSTEQEMAIEVNSLPAKVSDSIRASFISPSDRSNLANFCIGKRQHVKLHSSVDQQIKRQVDPTLA